LQAVHCGQFRTVALLSRAGSIRSIFLSTSLY
jgi:hypothetical protein